MSSIEDLRARVQQLEDEIRTLIDSAGPVVHKDVAKHAANVFWSMILEARDGDPVPETLQYLADACYEAAHDPAVKHCKDKLIELENEIRQAREAAARQHAPSQPESPLGKNRRPAMPRARRKGEPQSSEQQQYQQAVKKTESADLANRDNEQPDHSRELRAHSHRLTRLRDNVHALERRAPPDWPAIQLQLRKELRTALDGYKRRLEDLKSKLEVARRRIDWGAWFEAAKIAHEAALGIDTLDDDDETLIQEWANLPPLGGTDFDVSLARSARHAEQVMIARYRQLYGAGVEDLSILQIREPGDGRWRQADIDTPDGLIDVKNARATYSSRDKARKRYSGWFVRRFKTSGVCQTDVRIAGVVSPYLLTQNTSIRPVAVPIWIGEVTRSRLDELRQQFESDYLKIDLSPLEMRQTKEGKVLPGWLFDYPPIVYKNRERWRWQQGNLEASRNEWNAFVKRFPQGRPDDRASLFLHVLDRFCVAARDGASFFEDEIKEILWPSAFRGVAERSKSRRDRWKQAPLAIADPGEYLCELVGVLGKISKICQGEVPRYSSFRLDGRNIFRGRNRAVGRWETLYAYCGGRTRAPDGKVVPCGNEPLYAGCHAWCDCCGKLVCPECGHCQQDCSECQVRQQALRDKSDW